MEYCKEYQYCPVCGGDLTEGIDYLVCANSNCRKRLYISPKPTASALIFNSSGEVLLCKGMNPPTEDLWDIPGGFISLEESAEEATIREFVEETGVKISSLEYVGSYPSNYPFEDINYPILNFVFKAEATDIAKMKPQDDVKELKFFAPDDIPYDGFAFEWTKKMLKEWFKK